MARHDFESNRGALPSYMSDNMNVSSHKIKGVCYLIQRFGADLASTKDLRQASENGSIRLTQV